VDFNEDRVYSYPFIETLLSWLVHRNKSVIFGSTVVILMFAGAPLAEAEEDTQHVFPLMKELVKDRPNIPPPYGVAVVANWGDTDWQFTSASVGINDANVPAEFAANSSANIGISTVGAKADIWVLPFLNAFFVVGQAQADNQLLFRGAPLKVIPPGIGQPAQVVRGDVIVDFDMEGTFYTFGGVLTGGYKKFFATVDFSATRTNFGHKDAVTSDQSATYSVAPRVGYVVGLSQVWLGGRYFDYSTQFVGAIPIPSGPQFTFDVNLKTVSWNFTAGMRSVLKEHWEVMLEAGVGARHMITGSVGYRW
jgi:hypothetical protein